MTLVLDTGPLLALLDQSDEYHGRCLKLVQESAERRVIPAPVLTEVAYWIQERLSLRDLLALLEDVAAGAYEVLDLDSADYLRVRDICERYHDTPVGFVDAAVLAVVERLNEPKLATLDHRHFRMMRPRHVDALTLLPE